MKMSVMKLLYEYKYEINAIAQQNGIRNVRVFGSVAKDLEKNDSDVDLLVEIEDERTLFDLIRFKHSVEELLKRKVDVVSDASVNDMLKPYIIEEAVRL
jgi:predicted nucleotidyltransferase